MRARRIVFLFSCIQMLMFAIPADIYQAGAGVEDFMTSEANLASAIILVPQDFPTIQEGINSAVDGDMIFVDSGIYREHLIVNKTVSLVGEDADTTIVDGSGTGHVFDVISDNVSITGFSVRNSGSVHWPRLDAGICLNGTRGCTVTQNHVYGNGFSGISLMNSDHNKIANNSLSGEGWGGIHLMGSSRNMVSGNMITDKYGGINGHVLSDYNNITENAISNCTYGMFFHAANYNNIRRNNISAIAVEGIWLQDQVNYNVLADNKLVNSTVAIRLQGPNYYNSLSENFITGSEYGIKIENNAAYTRLTNNKIVNSRASHDSWSAGIRLDSGVYSQIYFNKIMGNRYGILLYSSSPYVSVYGNDIISNEFGLRVAGGGSDFLDVHDNIVINNLGYGIGLTGFGSASNYATIQGNLIVNNSNGIALGQYSNCHTIVENNISDNSCGFYIEYSTQNTIMKNNIIDNDQQVYLSTDSVNTWDGGYSAGGNHWSDYAGTDIHRGQDQNLLGSDGVGDTPYTITSSNLDKYPLTQSWHWTPSDVTIEAVTLSSKAVGQGHDVNANVTVTNEGINTEIFNVTFYANATEIETEEVVLSNGSSAILSFRWNTLDSEFGLYAIWVYAEPVLGESYFADNTYVASAVTVTILGDVNVDRDVGILDIVQIASIYGTHKTPQNSRYSRNCDVDSDGDIDILDVAVAASNYGRKW